jgi:hypothetical protein
MDQQQNSVKISNETNNNDKVSSIGNSANLHQQISTLWQSVQLIKNLLKMKQAQVSVRTLDLAVRDL